MKQIFSGEKVSELMNIGMTFANVESLAEKKAA